MGQPAWSRGEHVEPVPIRLADVGTAPARRRMGWVLFLIAFGVFALWIATKVPTVSIPLLIALFVAYIFAPPVSWLERRGIPRALAVFGIGLTLVGIVAGLGAIVAPAAWEEIQRLPDSLRTVLQTLRERFGLAVPVSADALIPMVTKELSQTPSGKLVRTGTTALETMTAIILVPIFSVLVLYHFDRARDWMKAQVPPRHRESVLEVTGEADHAIGAFLRGQLLVALILAVLYTIGFFLAGTPHPIVLGVVSGMGNFIPFVGTAIGIALATILTLATGSGVTTLILTFVVFAVVQAFEGWLITPKIVGDRVGLSATSVILAVALFGELFGFLGLLFAVPILACLRIAFGLVLRSYRRSRIFSGGAPKSRCETPGDEPARQRCANYGLVERCHSERGTSPGTQAHSRS
jgi:predicted PurR-regulated permease PerM